MIRACLLMLAGFYAPQLISFDVDSDLIAGAMVALLVMLFIPLLRPAAWLLAGAALFIVAALTVVAGRLAPELVGDSIVVDVTIADFPRTRADTVVFVACPTSDRRLPGRLRLSWYQPPVPVRIGDRWQFELRLRRPRGTANPGSFDFEAWMLRESIGAVGYVVAGPRNHLKRAGPATRLDAVRQRFVDRVLVTVADREQAAVLAALVVGARHLLGDAQWQRYAHTGTSHLMAISGLHVGLAASGGYLLTCLLLGGLRYAGNQHRVAVALGLLVAVAYALVSGWGIPARRAVLMLGLAAAALLRRRRPLPLRIVASVCMAVAVIDPLATMAPGFVLSFGAVAVLLWIAKSRPALPRTPAAVPVRAARSLRALGALQVALLFGLLPATALLFGRVALAAPPVNLVAVPLFSFVTVPLALLGFALGGAVAQLGDVCLVAAAWGIGMLEWLIERVVAIDGVAFVAPELSGVAWLLLLLPALQVLLPPDWPCRSIAWLALLALLTHVPATPATGCAELRVLDVGQGLAVLVRTRRSALLYDTGPAYRGGGSAAERVVVPLLARLRIARLDYLLISHSDSDHAGGAQTVLDAVRVQSLLVGEPLDGIDRRQRRCDTGARWRSDGVEFRILHPAAATSLAGNDASCVLQVRAGGRHVLLTGDIERRAENRLLERGLLHPVDAVTVPHHGSRTSSTPAFVAALSPDVAIVANGHGNRWGLPQAEIVERWQRSGAQVLETAESGEVRIRFCAADGALDVRRHRAVQHRIWHE